ncbi:MAG: hypothetical protein HPY75_13645 [Actinobacteria bacterium]|nr:hypothetical protein [Actinomycetota bacterium]
MSKHQKSDRNANRTYRIHLVASIFVFLMLLICVAAISCGSKDANEASEANPPSQEENAQSLGRIMAHRNQLEGELNEPVEAVIMGDIVAVAEAGEETWALVKVADFRTTSVPQGTLKAAPGSELSVRLRIKQGEQPPSVGAKAEINALVSKSMEGPVIIGRAFRLL